MPMNPSSLPPYCSTDDRRSHRLISLDLGDEGFSFHDERIELARKIYDTLLRSNAFQLKSDPDAGPYHLSINPRRESIICTFKDIGGATLASLVLDLGPYRALMALLSASSFLENTKQFIEKGTKRVRLDLEGVCTIDGQTAASLFNLFMLILLQMDEDST